MTLPNPGYPPPQNMTVVTKGGFMLKVGVQWAGMQQDRGVPTPVWLLMLDGNATLSNIEVDHIEGDIPPGCIVQFPQAGNAVDNAQKIIARSGNRKLGLTRRTDIDGSRITPS